MAAPAIGGSAGSLRSVARSPGRVGNEEFHSAALPTSQEAAILYSANFAEAAAQLLKIEIKDTVGRSNKQAWLMLFDLYQIAQNRGEFDALSMLFTVKFEQSPPVWAESQDAVQDPRRAQSRERKDFFALKPSASGDLAAEIDKFHSFAESMGTVRLDVAKVSAMTPEEATLLTHALQRLRRMKMPMWFNHLESLEKVLRAAFNERSGAASKPYWLLLFELLVLQGKGAEHEELGLEFAVAYEVSPPTFETYVNAVSASIAKTAPAPAPVSARAAGAAPPEAGFSLKGVVSAASANQIAEMNAYAASRSEVAIDMAKVLRLDFGFTAAFVDVVKAIQVAGKRVILTGLNELNAALLEALGVNRYAILVRRKST